MLKLSNILPFQQGRHQAEEPHVERGATVWISNGWGEDIRGIVAVVSRSEIGVHLVKGQAALHWFPLCSHGLTWRLDPVLGKTFTIVEPTGEL